MNSLYKQTEKKQSEPKMAQIFLQWSYLPRARTVHIQSQSVIYLAQIAHAYRRRTNEELHGRFLFMLFEAVLATVSTTENSAQLIFNFKLCQLLNL